MHIPALLKARFAEALSTLTDDPSKYADMIRGTNDPSFGDYQANCAMPLSKQAGKNPRELAAELVSQLKIDDLCEAPEIAGPGFINLKLKDSVLQDCLADMLADPRCLVPKTEQPKRIVIDFSSPNVAKPMHVGHIRSTVIGDALSRILRFLGHDVITDNHLGDWGTQFGMIIYGYKHFGDEDVVANNPVPELAKLYRQVNSLIEYRKTLSSIQPLTAQVEELGEQLAAAERAAGGAEGKEAKKLNKAVTNLSRKIAAAKQSLADAQDKIGQVQSDPEQLAIAEEHADVEQAVLLETAKLHAGDPINVGLWEKFLPHCQDEIERVYRRLHVQFDHTLGESFYHPMLADVVAELRERGLATESDGAICVFLDNFDAPMIVQKQDGAYLYSTTDLATLKYRKQHFDPAEILYVVDSRQGEHFQKLFDVARLTDLAGIKLEHVSFGTVLGDDRRPMKTRSGTLIGLESLLDDAVAGARQVVCQPERLESLDPPMDEAEQNEISEVIGIAAVKYADLSHHRSSDYVFNLSKMVALDGNTATYVQYNYARTQSILRKADQDDAGIINRVNRDGVRFTHPAERALALKLLQLEEALAAVYQDYAPNHLVEYLFETAKAYAVFNEKCHVINAESESIQTTRLALVSLSGRVLKLGLSLLGIRVVRRM
jgi:arginyl-tRNA synthetase